MWPFNKLARGETTRSISLSGQMDNFTGLEQLLNQTLAGYRGVIDSVVNHSPRMASGPSAPAGKDHSSDFRKALRQIRARLEGPPSVALVKETGKDIDREFANWGRSTEATFEAQKRETKDAMAAIAVMAEALSAHEKTYGVRFRGISKKLRLLTTSNDIAEIRKKLQSEIELLEQYVDQMTQASESALGRLRDLEDARRSRTAAMLETTTDDRKRIEDAIRAQIRTEDRVAVIRIDTDAALAVKGASLISARMQDVFESPALTGQWAKDSFISITRLPLPEAAARLEVVERDLSLKLGGKLDGSVFEKTPGTTVVDLLARCAERPREAVA